MKFHIVLVAAWFACVSVAAEVSVGAYYYCGYKGENDRQWGRTLRAHLTPPQGPELGRYDSRDSEIIGRHLQWSEEYGIDTWICSWIGSQYIEDSIIHDHVAEALAGSNVKFTILYESASRFRNRGGLRLDTDARATLQDDFAYLAWNFFHHENYLKIDGKPVVYMAQTGDLGADVAPAVHLARHAARDAGFEIYLVGDEIRWTEPDPDRIKLFNAITGINMHDSERFGGFPASTGFIDAVRQQYALYKSAADKAGVAFIPNVMPGFNHKGYRPRSNAKSLPRQVNAEASAASTLDAFCRAVKQVMRDTNYSVTVTSFNDWSADTQIEPAAVAEAAAADDGDNLTYTEGYDYSGYGASALEVLKQHFGE